jgi:3-oxoacyl-[acyl-carrier protein] reductase
VTDRYQQLANSAVGRLIVKNVGLPTPVELERYEPGQPVVSGPVLLGAAAGGRLAPAVASALGSVGAETYTTPGGEVRAAAADADLSAAIFNPEAPGEQDFKALVFDASGIESSEQLQELRAFFSPAIRRVRSCGRVIVLGTLPEATSGTREATAQRALEGFVRSAGKEVRGGSTAQLVYVTPDAEQQVESSLRFFLSPKSAYVSGQVVRIGPSDLRPEIDWEQPLDRKVALVTGAARGIGAAIASTLARDGAHVIGLDVPALADELSAATADIGGSSLALDITGSGAPAAIADHLEQEHQGVDVFVHNAGVTRDKTLGRMTEDLWNTVLAVNLSSEERINDELLGRGAIRENGRIVCVSSISGIAGNSGQTNYATSKAGVIGMVQAMAPRLAEQKLTINAVAPGFIETKMTAAMPLALREAGRRMNSLSQGGLPIDVAETIAWLASPASAGLNGNVIRVCGQALLGA